MQVYFLCNTYDAGDNCFLIPMIMKEARFLLNYVEIKYQALKEPTGKISVSS